MRTISNYSWTQIPFAKTLAFLFLLNTSIAAECPLEKNEAGEYLIASYQNLQNMAHEDCIAPYRYRLTQNIDARSSFGENCDSLGVCGGFQTLQFPEEATVKIHGGGHSIDSLLTQDFFFNLDTLVFDSVGFKNFELSAVMRNGFLGGSLNHVQIRHSQLEGQSTRAQNIYEGFYTLGKTLHINQSTLKFHMEKEGYTWGFSRSIDTVQVDSSLLDFTILSSGHVNGVFDGNVVFNHSKAKLDVVGQKSANAFVWSGYLGGTGSEVNAKVYSAEGAASVMLLGVSGSFMPLKDFILISDVEGATSAVGFGGVCYLENEVWNVDAEVKVRSQGIAAGLCTHVSGGILKGKLKGVVSGVSSVGGLAKTSDHAVVDSLEVDLTVYGESVVGGLFARSFEGEYKKIYGTIQVQGVDTLGGVVAKDSSSQISHLDLKTEVVGRHYIGGVLGVAQSNEYWNIALVTKLEGQSYVGGVSGAESLADYFQVDVQADSIEGFSYIGGISGFMGQGTFYGVEVKGELLAKSGTVGHDYLGGVFGMLEESEIEHSTFVGSLSGASYLGGIAGKSVNSTLYDLQVEADFIQGGEDAFFLGGIVGEGQSGSYSDLHFKGAVFGGTFVGGIAGFLYGSGIQQATSEGDIRGQTYVGGVVGRLQRAGVLSVTFKGDVFGEKFAAGGISGLGEGANHYDVLAEGVIRGKEFVGGISGGLDSCSVINARSHGRVEGAYLTGGLVGHLGRVEVEDSYSEAHVFGGELVGGIAGLSNYRLVNSANYGTVIGMNKVGGLFGALQGGYVFKSANYGSVKGGHVVAGLVGSQLGGSLENVLNTGSIEGDSLVAGIVGINDYKYTTKNYLNTGAVRGRTHVAGILAQNNGFFHSTINLGILEGDSLVSPISIDSTQKIQIWKGFYWDPFTNESHNSSQVTIEEFALEESFPGLDFDWGWSIYKGFPRIIGIYDFNFALPDEGEFNENFLLESLLDNDSLSGGDSAWVEVLRLDSNQWNAGLPHFAELQEGDTLHFTYRIHENLREGAPVLLSNETYAKLVFKKSVEGTFNFHLGGFSNEIEVFNIRGDLVFKTNQGVQGLRESGLKPGSYYLHEIETKRVKKWVVDSLE